MCESGPRPGLCWRIRAVRQVNSLHYSTLKKRHVIDVLQKTAEVFHGSLCSTTKLSTLGVYTVHFHDQGLKMLTNIETHSFKIFECFIVDLNGSYN